VWGGLAALRPIVNRPLAASAHPTEPIDNRRRLPACPLEYQESAYATYGTREPRISDRSLRAVSWSGSYSRALSTDASAAAASPAWYAPPARLILTLGHGGLRDSASAQRRIASRARRR